MVFYSNIYFFEKYRTHLELYTTSDVLGCNCRIRTAERVRYARSSRSFHGDRILFRGIRQKLMNNKKNKRGTTIRKRLSTHKSDGCDAIIYYTSVSWWKKKPHNLRKCVSSPFESTWCSRNIQRTNIRIETCRRAAKMKTCVTRWTKLIKSYARIISYLQRPPYRIGAHNIYIYNILID